MVQRLSSGLVKHNGITLAMYLDKEKMNTPDLTPYDFGAVGDGIADDSDALQRMFDSRNSSAVLADNFFGTFKLRGKFRTTKEIHCGRPIKVDALGAEFIVTGSYTAVSFSMHNGIWIGGYFNYTEVANGDINENAIAMNLAPEVTPIMVMASTISHVRIWGAHTGIKFDNPNSGIWAVHFNQIQPWVRAGASQYKARGFDLRSDGAGTTLRLSECMVAGYGSTPGVGLKGFYLDGFNEAIMQNCAYDWYDMPAGVARTVGERDVIDATVFRLEIQGFHTEQLVNTTATWGESPMYINTNSCTLEGFEMLLTDTTQTNAWIWLAGNGVATIGSWHDLPKQGRPKGHVLNLANFAKDGIVQSTANVRSADILGASTKMEITIAGEPSVFGVDADVTVTPGNVIFNMPEGTQACKLTIVGSDTSSSDLGWVSELLCYKVATGGWVVKDNLLKAPAFEAAQPAYNVTINNELVFTNNSALSYRIQTRVEWKRAAVSAYVA